MPSPQQQQLNSALPYASARDMGVSLLTPPHVLAPTVMNPPVEQPRVYNYPYPVPMTMPMLPPAPAAIPIPKAIQQFLPKKPAAPVEPPPEIIPLGQIANGLDSSVASQQREAMQGLQKLLAGNPDFKKPKSGSMPESILLKALKSQDEMAVGELLSSMSSDLEATTPRLRRALKQVQNNQLFMPPTRQLAAQVVQGNQGQAYRSSTLNKITTPPPMAGQRLDVTSSDALSEIPA